MEHDMKDFWDLMRPEPVAMPPKLKAKHKLRSAQCPRCGSFDTREGEDTHGAYWRCLTCKQVIGGGPPRGP